MLTYVPVEKVNQPKSLDKNQYQRKQTEAKSLLAASLAPVASDLFDLESQFLQFIPIESQSSDAVLKYFFQAPGKRIRPALFFLVARLFQYRGKDYFPIAAVCEFVHTASLLHDDVVDNSSLRRNKPTSNSIWGDQASVLVGDLIYARASEMMAATGSIEIVKTFAAAIRRMSEGELMQLEHCFNSKISEQQYFAILHAKTAALLGACCKSAALLANQPTEQVMKLEAFGISLGLAFQLIDDALDYMGSREFFGKPTLSDLGEGKITLPIILLLRKLPPNLQTELEEMIQSKKTTDENIRKIADWVREYDTASHTMVLANNYTDKALAMLSDLPDSQAKRDLELLALRLVGRMN